MARIWTNYFYNIRKFFIQITRISNTIFIRLMDDSFVHIFSMCSSIMIQRAYRLFNFSIFIYDFFLFFQSKLWRLLLDWSWSSTHTKILNHHLNEELRCAKCYQKKNRVIILWVKSNDKLKNHFSSSLSEREKKNYKQTQTARHTAHNAIHAQMATFKHYYTSNGDRERSNCFTNKECPMNWRCLTLICWMQNRDNPRLINEDEFNETE